MRKLAALTLVLLFEAPMHWCTGLFVGVFHWAALFWRFAQSVPGALIHTAKFL